MAVLPERAAVRTAAREGAGALRFITAWSHSPWLIIVVLWLLSRLAVFALALAFLVVSGNSLTAHPLATLWLHYDARHYLAIALDGYSSPYLASFFPLYPAITRLVLVLSWQAHPLLAALLVSNAATLAACLGLARMAALEHDDAASGSASVQLFLAAPLALFLVAPWAQSLLVACIVWALGFARQGRWPAAAGCALGAALTNPAGIALVAPLAYEYVHQHGGWRAPWSLWWQPAHAIAVTRTRRLRNIAVGLAVVLAAPLGVAAYAIYCFVRFGDPLLIVHAQQQYFGHYLTWPWQTLGLVAANFAVLHASPIGEARLMLDVLPVLLCGLLIALTRRSMPRAYTLYLLALLALCVAAPVTGTLFPDALVSTGRYLLAAAPLFVAAGHWSIAHPRWHLTLLAGGWLLQAALLVLSCGGIWIV